MTNHEKPWYASALESLLLSDAPRILGISPEAFERDVNTLTRRISSEGESFLTKTLPTLGKSFDLALQDRAFNPTSFKKKAREASLPAFLQALTTRVFTDEGDVVTSPCIRSIRLMRQVCFWYKKVEKGFTDESLRRAIEDFVSVDRDLPPCDLHFGDRTLRLARDIVTHIFGKHPRMGRLFPAHGPGAVFHTSHPVRKRMSRNAYAKLERVFRPNPFFFSLAEMSMEPQRVYDRIKCEFGLSRIAFVEKDSNGPRIIGLEPAEYMWCQQALKRFLYPHIENHPFTSGHVNFTDQSVNQMKTSEWDRFDTLDMSKASDRVSYALVKYLFSDTWLWPYLDACRTPGTVLPSGEVFLYRKFAPMGSAVCFPVESIVFFVLTLSALRDAGVPLSIARQLTFVYGDDIVLPHGFFPQVKSTFERYHLRFNEDKSCVTGKFRESCGMDSFDGQVVTPVRLRKAYPRAQDPSTLIPVVMHSNQLHKAGYWAAASTVKRDFLRLYRWVKNYYIPVSDCELPILHWYNIFARSNVKWKVKNSIHFVYGIGARPDYVEADVADEVPYLRESLSRGGPVGRLITSRGKRVRVIDKRFSTTLYRGWFPASTVRKLYRE